MKDILAEHFDRSPVKTEVCTQYYQGEYWGPKHQDSLAFLIESLNEPVKNKLKQLADNTVKALDAIEDKISESISSIISLRADWEEEL